MKKSFFVSTVLYMLVLFACKKTQQADTHASQLDKIWIGFGQGHEIHYGRNGNVFFSFKPVILNSMQIIGITDTIRYQVTDNSTHTVIFGGSFSSYKQVDTETLVYNYANNTITDDYDFSSGGTGGYYGQRVHLLARENIVDPAAKQYISKIAGIRALSGTVYDTLVVRTPPDSSYSLAANIEFKVVDDLTLTYNRDFLDVGDDTLHYKAFDENAKTIIFETFHYQIGEPYTTITYNYLNDAVIFEQVDFSEGYSRRRLKLQ